MAYDDSEPRDERGQWTSGGSGAAAAHARMDHLTATAHQADGTYDRFGRNPKTGFMVGGAPDRGSRYTGVWTDKASGVTYREKSNRVNSETLARSLSRRRNQIATYDLGRGREINTGGTGAYTPSKGGRYKMAGTRH
jgi:hypothetical protein